MYLIILAANVWNINVVGGRTDIFVLLVGEDINAHQVHLGVTVLAGLRGGHLHNLARAPLDHHEAVLAKCRTLQRESLRGTGAGVGIFFLTFHG